MKTQHDLKKRENLHLFLFDFEFTNCWIYCMFQKDCPTQKKIEKHLFRKNYMKYGLFRLVYVSVNMNIDVSFLFLIEYLELNRNYPHMKYKTRAYNCHIFTFSWNTAVFQILQIFQKAISNKGCYPF